jgi:hypothetical protein
MRRSLLLASLLGLLAACGPAPSGGPIAATSRFIVGGAEAPNDVAVVLLSLDEVPLCSGSLLGERTVLTAAHCVLGPDLFPLASIQVNDGGGTRRHQVEAQHVHPEFDESSGAHDLMLLQLETKVAGARPLELYPRPLTSEDVGRDLRVVGYGATEGGTVTGLGTRREVTLLVRQLRAFDLEAGATGKQACVGDSGGPALLRVRADGPEYVAATVSGGADGCLSTGYYTRVDLDTSWIVSTAAAWEVVVACAQDGTCRPDCSPADADCPAAESAPGESSCSSTGAAKAPWLLLALSVVSARARRARASRR